jgi:hypothetical protein
MVKNVMKVKDSESPGSMVRHTRHTGHTCHILHGQHADKKFSVFNELYLMTLLGTIVHRLTKYMPSHESFYIIILSRVRGLDE